MSYLETYKKRVGHLGTTPQDRAYNSGILEFRRYLKYNQHTERDLILDREQEKFDGVILTDKEDENRVSQILLTKVIEDGGPAIKQGDLIWWGEDTNPWLVYRFTTSSYQPHQKFYMVRCNYKIKWIDKEGFLKESWIYLLGSKDSKIKDNFRTWHNAITPQPNKYINIIMPHQLMAINTEIMVLDEVWYLVDYDQASVPGVIYMSFTETNLNEQRDSVEDSIANIDKQAEWTIDMLNSRVVEPNAIFDLNYAILKDGVIQKVQPEITLEGNLVLNENGQIQVGATGAGTITINYKGISKTQSVTVGGTPQVKLMFTGSDKIRVASKNNKYVVENVPNEAEIQFVLIDLEDQPKATDLVSMKVENNSCLLEANNKNKLGKFNIQVFCNGEQKFEKTIAVVSLWQVI